MYKCILISSRIIIEVVPFFLPFFIELTIIINFIIITTIIIIIIIVIIIIIIIIRRLPAVDRCWIGCALMSRNLVLFSVFWCSTFPIHLGTTSHS